MSDNTFFVCDKCSRTLSNQSNVDRHEKVVHSEAVRENFTCTVCDAGQISTKGYIQHLQLDHEISIKIDEKNFETVDGE